MNTQPLSLSLILIHGNGGGGFRFERSLPDYPAQITITAPTLPGFAGQPRDPQLQTVADYADALRDHVAGQPAPRVLLGTGVGGAFALDFAQRHASLLDGMILHAPVGTRLDTRLFPRLMRLPLMTQLGQWVFSTPLTRPLFKRLLFHEPVPEDYLARFFDEYARCAVFGQMFEIITSAWFDSLHPVDLPTALLWGERERILSVDQLEDYKALLPHHRVQIIPEWDHFPMIETPHAFAQVTTNLATSLIQPVD